MATTIRHEVPTIRSKAPTITLVVKRFVTKCGVAKRIVATQLRIVGACTVAYSVAVIIRFSFALTSEFASISHTLRKLFELA